MTELLFIEAQETFQFQNEEKEEHKRDQTEERLKLNRADTKPVAICPASRDPAIFGTYGLKKKQTKNHSFFY